MKRHGFVRALMFLPFVLLLIALFGWVVMALWNALIPTVFGLKAISYWQALGLFVLSKILFGGFRGAAGGDWRRRMRERFERMTPEERERFHRGFCSPSPDVASTEPKPNE